MDLDPLLTPRPQPYDIDKTIAVLRSETEEHRVLPPGAIYGLSDLAGDALQTFKAEWPTIGLERRRSTTNFLAEMSETNFELTFEGIAYVLFEDADAEVRAKAPEMVWYARSGAMFEALLKLAKDPVSSVRAAAMLALGRFIYDAEMEEFDQDKIGKAHEVTLESYRDLNEDVDVRRRALEALSHCSHPAVPGMIEEAYNSDEPLMQVSAVFAMGASCDQRWSENVMLELDNENPEMRYEAVRTAGALGLKEAVPQLIDLTDEEDYEIRLMTVWSLGEIGTKEAVRQLEALASEAEVNDDEVLLDAVEEAMEMAQLYAGLNLRMFEFLDDEGSSFDDDMLL